LKLPINRRAASMTAAPLSIVAMSISCPGQSTKEICLCNSYLPSHSLFSHFGLSSLSEPKALKHSGGLHSLHLYNLALA